MRGSEVTFSEFIILAPLSHTEGIWGWRLAKSSQSLKTLPSSRRLWDGPYGDGAEVGLHVWSDWFLYSLRGPLGHLSPGSVDLSTRDWDSACPLGGWLCQQQRQLQWEGQALHPRKAWALTFFPRVVPPLHNEKKLISTWWQPGCSSCQFPCRDPL